MKELRNYNRSLDINNRLVTGYALVFNSFSNDLGGFVETIEPSALDGVLEISDVLCLLNHNIDRGVLARWNKGIGSLKLEVDEIGLKYSFEAPNTALGDELLEGLKRGDISSSSFAFTIDKDEWSKNADGTYVRTIKHFKELFDVSPVWTPAYDATSVKADTRGLKDFISKEREDLENYFLELKNKVNL